MNKFVIEAVLSEYAGNHERELTAWVFGAESEYMPGGYVPRARPHVATMNWAYDPQAEEGSLQMFPHDEYGMVWQDIGDDREWYKEQKAKDPATNYYGRMVRWELFTEPTDEQWDALEEALDTYDPKVQVEKLSLKQLVTTKTVLR